MKNSYITGTDHFCGAGGSTQGAKKAGVEMTAALNHWRIALDTYEENNPEVQTYCADVSNSDPRYFPSTTMAIMSPECTVHSPAGGNHYSGFKKQMDLFSNGTIDPSADRSRMTMWDVPRFAEYHKYEFIIVENVVEAKTRWPLFEVWLKAMHTLGYKHKLCFLNSMHFHPTPQSRDRMYVVFWKKGNNKPDLKYEPKAYCEKCSHDVDSVQWWKNSEKNYGKYKQQYLFRCPGCHERVEPYYHAAFNVIDWSISGKPVLDRKIPLRPNTIKRIEFGLKKFGDHNFIIKGGFDRAAMNIRDALPTQTTQENHAIVSPYFINTDHSTIESKRCVRSGFSPFRTVTTADTDGIVIPSPFLVELYGTGKSKSLKQAIGTQMTTTKHGIISSEAFRAFMTTYNGNSVISTMEKATSTITTVDRISLITHKAPTLDECMYRTIRAHEVKKAMAFDEDYNVLGTGKQQVKQLGNAVTPPVMEWLVGQCVASLN